MSPIVSGSQQDATTNGKADLELIDLHRSFGPTIALDGLSFTVRAGQMMGFVGPNGAGKTTAMRIVLGVLEPNGGEVLWAGKPVDREVRRRFGYMPEERGLYPKMKVRDQLVYFGRLHAMSIADAEASADALIDKLGVAERASDSVEALSLGNQQRVQLAAALVHRPDVLVLDEPFSGLDPVGVDVMAEVLKEQTARGVPVVFSSHQLELVERLCDDYVLIHSGRMVASGRVGDLDEPLADVFRLQSTTSPLSMLILAALFGAIFVANNPDSIIGLIGTLLPFSAPLIVPVRAATGDIELWNVAASLLIMGGSIFGLIRMAGRLYSGAILRTGGTVKLREASASATS